MNKTLRAAVATALMFSTSLTSVAVVAAPITAEQAMQAGVAAATSQQRAEVVSWLQRDDVRQEMTRLGVSSEQAVERVSALSDEEVQRLHGRIGQAQVAGNGIVGAIVFVFLVLLVTDILGLTKVFPFTRSIR
ncbi:MAG: PA2779 family protein [Perlucidibaca sp.]